MTCNKYEIRTVADFHALSKEQREKCAIDMLAWADFIDEYAKSPLNGLIAKSDVFVWVDDDLIGEISGVIIEGRK